MKYRERASRGRILNKDIIMPLVIQQWIVLVVMFVLVIAIVSWSATYLGKRSSKAENNYLKKNINLQSGNVIPSEDTISYERGLQYIDSIDVLTTSEESMATSGTAVNLETLENLATLQTFEDSSTLGTAEKYSTLVETETSEVTDATLAQSNTEVTKISEASTFSTTECPDTENYKEYKETSSYLNTPQDIQEFTASSVSI